MARVSSYPARHFFQASGWFDPDYLPMNFYCDDPEGEDVENIWQWLGIHKYQKEAGIFFATGPPKCGSTSLTQVLAESQKAVTIDIRHPVLADEKDYYVSYLINQEALDWTDILSKLSPQKFYLIDCGPNPAPHLQYRQDIHYFTSYDAIEEEKIVTDIDIPRLASSLWTLLYHLKPSTLGHDMNTEQYRLDAERKPPY